MKMSRIHMKISKIHIKISRIHMKMSRTCEFYSFSIMWKLISIHELRIQNKIWFIINNESDKKVNSTWLMIILIEYYSICITHIVSTHFCRYSTHSHSNNDCQDEICCDSNSINLCYWLSRKSYHNQHFVKFICIMSYRIADKSKDSLLLVFVSKINIKQTD